jgi:hypothetical protein
MLANEQGVAALPFIQHIFDANRQSPGPMLRIIQIVNLRASSKAVNNKNRRAT